MKRIAWVAASCALVGWGTVGMIGGCGSDELVTVDPDGGDATASSSGSSGGTDGGGSSSSGSNPGKVTCGALECDAGINAGNGDPQCCYGPADAGGPTCVDNAAACQGGAHRLRCDEPADCPPRERCCIDTSGGGGATASCSNDCDPDDELDLCKDNAQCGDGGTCRQVTCNNGRVYRSCTVGNNTSCR